MLSLHSDIAWFAFARLMQSDDCVHSVVTDHVYSLLMCTGAQMTIMSKACADRCHISHLIDRRWAGMAKGVGVQRILGRVHMCEYHLYIPVLQ